MDAYTGAVGTFPLPLATEGEPVRIAGFNGGESFRRKLTDLGLAVGNVVSVRHRQDGGGMVIAQGDSRIAVGFGIAYRILVVASSDELGRSGR